MFTIAVGDKIEVRIYCFHAGAQQLACNTVRLEAFSNDVPGPVPSNQVADSLSAFFALRYIPLLDSSALYAGVSVQDFPARQMVPSFSTISQDVGGVVGSDVPTQICGLISMKTNFAKRWGRGRLYIPFPSATSNDGNGSPTAAYMVSLNLLASNFQDPGFTSLVGPDTAQIRWKTHIGVRNEARPEIRLVKNAFGVDAWATQRRRGSYGRKNTLPVELTSV